jgi:hypothetical protein
MISGFGFLAMRLLLGVLADDDFTGDGAGLRVLPGKHSASPTCQGMFRRFPVFPRST